MFVSIKILYFDIKGFAKMNLSQKLMNLAELNFVSKHQKKIFISAKIILLIDLKICIWKYKYSRQEVLVSTIDYNQLFKDGSVKQCFAKGLFLKLFID